MRGQFFDNIAQFDCWSTEASEADILVDYFEECMSWWTGVLGYNGIERIWFWGRGMDAVESRWRNDIHARSAQYFFRTEDVQIHVDFMLRGLNLAISVEEATGITGINPIEDKAIRGIESRELNAGTKACSATVNDIAFA